MKKTVLLLLCALLFVGSVCAEGYGVIWEGSGATCGDNLSWSLDGATLYITGSGDMYDFPGGAPWMGYQSVITQVYLSDGVTSVGAYAFQNYAALVSVSFGNSLVSIGKDAFSGCNGLTSVTLPATFKKFGENCFRSCKNLTAIYCSGGFPRFDENCLWDTGCTIVYSAANPWSVSLIAQLEEAFHNRIEFRSSDGTDPYVPTQATEAPTEPAPQETFWVTEPPTMPAYTEPVTEPVTIPVYTEPPTVATVPPQTAPPATQPTIVLATEVAAPPSYQGGSSSGGSVFGVLIVGIVLAIVATGALLVRTASGGRRRKRRRRGRYDR